MDPGNPGPTGGGAVTDMNRTRAKKAKRGRALERADFVATMRGDVRQSELDAAMARLLTEPPAATTRRRGGTVSVAAGGDAGRWVPIGPSVVRQGQAVGRPRVVGRIRDVWVDTTGMRIYAAAAKGGVWYSGDGGTTWDPIAGFDPRVANVGGTLNPLVCGCLLVNFGANAAADHVMVGTGEIVPWVRPTGHSQWGGLGVFAATGPTTIPVGQPTWEAATGLTQLEGRGIFRLARQQGAVTAGLANDLVVAATDAGLYVSRRAGGAYPWVREPILDALTGAVATRCTDAVWIAGGANGRLFVAVDSQGVVFSDNIDGVNAAAYVWNWVPGLGPGATIGRVSLAVAPSGALYALGERVVVAAGAGVNTPSLWQIAVPTATPLVPATLVTGVPAAIWTVNGNNQRDYDQAIAVDTTTVAPIVDRVYLGGSATQPTPADDFGASLWCFDVPAVAPLVLAAALGVSTTGNPPGDGADQAGLIGNNVHADVHSIRVTGAVGAPRQVWVGCDGGVFASAQAGRCNSFQPRATGMAVLETGFVASHPTSNHFLAVGVQDNGTQVRVGDTVWEEIQVGDGGGVAFHPTRSDVVVSQYVRGGWRGLPTSRFTDPLTRTKGGRAIPGNTEGGAPVSAFYSGAASIAHGAGGRIAIGTNRLWISDSIGSLGAIAWTVLPFPGPAVAQDTYVVNGAGVLVDTNAAFGNPGLGSVITVKFASDNVIHALYQNGVVTYTFSGPPANTWTAAIVLPDPGGTGPILANTTLTDIAPVPGSLSDFYLTTVGENTAGVPPLIDTCWLYTGGAFTGTALRSALNQPGPPVVMGPLDPAYSVVVDSVANPDVFVGTATGVWIGIRDTTVVPNTWLWNPLVNGLPTTAAQDLNLWVDPVAGGPRLLRAATQARGVWEVNLATAFETQRTYLRVHPHDDRRHLRTPLANPRAAPGGTAHVTFASPDIVVRPQAGPAAAPKWRLAAGVMNATNAPIYELWTFQTAFRWIYPSVIASGQWSDQFADLVRVDRAARGLGAGAFVDQALWNAVVNVRLTAAGSPTGLPADPLAVYRDPWQSATALTTVASEIDVIEAVRPVRDLANIWRVYREPSTVDVLIHHRDTRPRPANDAFALLIWQSNLSQVALLNTDLTALPGFMTNLLSGNLGATPGGWNLATTATGAPLHQLPVELDARTPRAVPINVDLSTVTAGHHVLFVAVVGSGADGCTAAATAPTNTVPNLVQGWPHAAARLVRVFTR